MSPLIQRPLTVAAIFVVMGLLCGCGGGGGSNASRGSTAVLPEVTFAPATPVSGTTGASDDWTTFQHDQGRSGQSDVPISVTASNLSSLKLQWAFQSAAIFVASPLLVNGIVYAVDNTGELSALNALTGSLLWQKQLGGTVSATPAIYNGMLFVGLHNEGAPSPIIALDPTTGDEIWRATLPGPVRGSPVAMNGILYVPVAGGDEPYCISGGIYELNEDSGTAQTDWLTNSIPSGGGGGIWSPLAIDNGNIYFGTGNTCRTIPRTNNAIVSITPAMAKRWAYPTVSINSDDDVGGGTIAIPGTDELVTMSKSGNLFALTANGQLLWKLGLGAPDALGGYATPNYTDSTIIISGGFMSTTPPYGGAEYGVSTSGHIEWTYTTQNPIIPSAVSSGNLVFLDHDDEISVLDASSGNVLWSYQLADITAVSPALGPSGVITADDSGMLYAFGPGTTNSQTARRLIAAARARGRHPYKLPSACKPQGLK